MSTIDKKKRSPLTCPSCDMLPCRCPGGGGADGDDENTKPEDQKVEQNKDTPNVTNNQFNISNIADKRLLPAWCTLFALEENDLQVDNTENTTNTSLTMGMKMGGMEE